MPFNTLAPIPSGLTLSALMLTPAAFAADATPAPTTDTTANPAKPAEEVVVQSQRDMRLASPKQVKSLLDTPATVTVVPAQVIQQQGASSLMEVMRNSPGISMMAGEGGTGGAPGDSMSIRGFSARKDIFVDGVRDFGSYSRDPFNLEQVEVIKGPSSALGGRGSTGGLVSLVTKQAQKDNFYAGWISGGTDSYKRLTLDLNQSLDNGTDNGIKNAAIRVNAVGFDADAPGRDYVTNQRAGISPTMTFGLGTPTQLLLSFYYMKQDNMPDFGIPFVPLANNGVAGVQGYGNKVAPVAYSNFYGLIDRDHEHINTKIGEITFKHDFRNGVLFSNHTQYGSTYRDSVISAPRFSNTTTTNINHELQTLDETDKNITNQTDVTIKFATGSVRHTVVTGIEFARETSVNYARGAYNPGKTPANSAPLAAAAFPATDLFHPDAYQPYAYSVLHTGASSDTTAYSQALYLFDTLDLNEQWSVMAGLRWDRFKADATTVSTQFTGSVVKDLTRTDKMLNWRGSVSYKPMANGNIYASFGTSSNPSAEGLTLNDAANSLNSSNLAPEKSVSYELGTKWALLKERLLLSGALFQTTKTNARTEDPANPNDVINLSGEQRVQGIEVSATGRLSDQWSVLAGYAYMKGKIVSSANPLEVGQPLSSAPEHSGNLWTTYSFPFHLDIGGGATYVSQRVVNTTATRYVDSFLTFDAMASYKVNSHFDLQLNVYNLTDRQYVLDMYNTGSSGHVIPGSGRSATLTAAFRF